MNITKTKLRAISNIISGDLHPQMIVDKLQDIFDDLFDGLKVSMPEQEDTSIFYVSSTAEILYYNLWVLYMYDENDLMKALDAIRTIEFYDGDSEKYKAAEEKVKGILSEESKEIIIQTIAGPLAISSEKGGLITLGDTRVSISPKTIEFKVLNRIAEASPNHATYKDLGYGTKTSRAELQDVIRHIKNKLGILPKTKTSIKDIFTNVKGAGYKIVSPE